MKKIYLGQLLEITRQQQVALQENAYEQYIKLLYERGPLIKELEELLKKDPLTVEERDTLIEIKRIDDENNAEYHRQYAYTKEMLKKLNDLKPKNMQYVNPYDMLATGLNFDKHDSRRR